jgi:SAM-dependent methyltransferase
VTRRLEAAAADLQFADARFLTEDSRFDLVKALGENTIDLIVTSPPYPNATDYHLYHRFRLFWLGFDPRDLGRIEIGSHLRHQRNDTGFEEYREDMAHVLQGCGTVLQPGRYAVFVVGDAIFKGTTFSTSSAICEAARDAELTVIGAIDRPIHETKRSFAMPARRARKEQLVILQRPNRAIRVQLNPPAYKMWKYEEELRSREIKSVTGCKIEGTRADPITLTISQPELWKIRRLTFTRDYVLAERGSTAQPTWQKIIENGDGDPAKRKDPKYATHGLHPFKGKFYPQLVKSLLNISEAPLKGRLLDPFCGSGTTLLEGMLNGYTAFGCDFNPLAARIARAKTAILSVRRDVTDLAMRALHERVAHPPLTLPSSLDQFPAGVHEEIQNWFPTPVIHKLSWLLTQIRMFGNETLVGYFEMLVSSIIREVSQQDPTDLRIRRRKQSLEDAEVFDLFKARLEDQQYRLQKYWAVAGRQPGPLIPPVVIEGDCAKQETMNALGLQKDTVDCVVTSPPYATALPYIDTDRLSLLAVLGLASSKRSELEEKLTGSREIRQREKQESEDALFASSAFDVLPRSVVESIRRIHKRNASSEVGFRRANMPALLWRYFMSMRQNLAQVSSVLKTHAKAFYVVGNSRTNSGGEWITIETCKHIATIAESIGLRYVGSINIDVTRENYKHIRNAITENEVIMFEKS